MAAGGYDDERWWETEEDKALQRGETTAEGPRRSWREDRDMLRADPARIGRLLKEGTFTSRQAEQWEAIVRMTDQDFEDALAQSYPTGRQTQPLWWNDAAFNQPAQPVVGVCWHEARAFAAWLTAQTRVLFRLPTEQEWEAAARGRQGRRCAYGPRFDPRAANTFESHIRRTTPVGIFPRGDTPEGVCDSSGNVWEWTGSIYQSYQEKQGTTAEPPATGDSRRVLRGGSWDGLRGRARAAARNHSHPGDRNFDCGLRLVRLSPIFE
jgi:formylglycine-generating enzyme required for sulfatase activity